MMVLGIDYSTQRCGFAIMDSLQNIHFCQSVTFKEDSNAKQIRQKIREFVKELLNEYKIDFIILERVRLFSRGKVNFDTIYNLSCIISTIVDSSDKPVYSIDTRAWKARILGSAKATKDDSIKYVREKYGIECNHDLADSICIAECGIRFIGIPLIREVF